MTFRLYSGDSNVFETQQLAYRCPTAEHPDLMPFEPTEIERWLIVGGGGFGREVYHWTLGHLHSGDHGGSVGFLDDNQHCLDTFPDLVSLWRGRISEYSPQPGDRLLMAIADPAVKLKVGEHLIARGALFASFAHPKAIISPDTLIGVGCILCPFSVVCCNVRVGNFVSMNIGALVGHDSIVGDGGTLSPHSDVAGQVELERGVFLGCQTVILPKTKVGEFARVGAGSVVISNVRSHSTMMGVPAKRISWNKTDDAPLKKAA